jgi:hypothetical protein
MPAQHHPARAKNGTCPGHPKQAKDAKSSQKSGFAKHDLILIPPFEKARGVPKSAEAAARQNIASAGQVNFPVWN